MDGVVDLQTVISALQAQPHTAEVQAWGCAALRNITEDGGSASRARAVQLGALELVVAALKEHALDAMVQECGCAALGGLSKDPLIRAQLADFGGVEVIIDVLRDNPAEEEVQRWALSALGELLRQGEAVGARSAKLGCLELVFVAMQLHPGAPQVQACGCAVLARLALFKATSIGITVAEIDAGGRGLLSAAMQEHLDAAEVQACGCSAIGAIANRGVQSLTRLLVSECGFLDLVVTALRQHPSEAAVQERGCSALRCLLQRNSKHESGYSVFVARASELGVERLLVDALHNHPASFTVQAAALSALKTFSSALADDQEEPASLFVPNTPVECNAAVLFKSLHGHPNAATVQEPALALLWGLLIARASGSPFAEATLLALQALQCHPSMPAVQALACAVLQCCFPQAWPEVSVREGHSKLVFGAIRMYPLSSDVQEYGWSVLLRLIQAGGLAALAEVEILHVLEQLVEVMREHQQSARIQRVCCDCLALCCLDPNAGGDDFSLEEQLEEHRRVLLELGAPGLVVHAAGVHAATVQVQESACAALQALAGRDCNKLLEAEASGRIPRAAGPVEAFLMASLRTHPDSVAVQVRALDLLMALAPASQGKGAGGLLPGVDLAMTALHWHFETPEVAVIAAEALARFLACDPGRGERPEPMTVVAATLASMEGEAPGLTTRSILRHLARYSHDVATRIVAWNGIELLTQVLAAHTGQESLQEAVASILETLAVRCSPTRVQLAQREGAMDPLLHSMNRWLHSPSVQARCCALLAHLSADGGPSAAELASRGSLERLAAALSAHPEDAQVSAWGCLAVQNLCCGVHPAAEAIRQQAHNLEVTELICRRLLSSRTQMTQTRPKSATSTASLSTTADEVARHAAQMFQATCTVGLHCLASSEDSRLALASTGVVLEALTPALDAAVVIEVRERACHLICLLALASEKVKTDFLAAGSQLWVALLAAVRDHLAAAEAEDPESSSTTEDADEVILSLPSPNQSNPVAGTSAGTVEEDGCQLRAMPVSSPALLRDVMQVLPAEPRIQATCCSAIRRLALLAARGRGRDRVAVIREIPQAVQVVVEALEAHERSAEVQQTSVMALQALMRLSTSPEAVGEEATIENLVKLGTVPLLIKALRIHPDDAQIQEQGLDILRVLATGGRRPDVLEALPGLGAIQVVIEAMNLNVARPKIQEYGAALLAEFSWAGEDGQSEVASKHGVQMIVRALKAFIDVSEVQIAGMAALQAIVIGREEFASMVFDEAPDILERILKVMGNFPRVEGVQAYGCAALMSMCHNNKDRTETIISLGGISLVESAKVGHLRSERVQEFGDRIHKRMRQVADGT
mmetsp:Transcript_78771/g.139021  ORF Transcript_78771/g.139021 Transcript_78771/m.139021 type:complete len:1336 (+) Transcript_78771:34-4041(+)